MAAAATQQSSFSASTVTDISFVKLAASTAIVDEASIGTDDTASNVSIEMDDSSSEPEFSDLEEDFRPDVFSHTTLVLRGIPKLLTVEDLLLEFVERGFENRFDFVYLPMEKPAEELSAGCAYINLLQPADAVDFQREFHLHRLDAAGEAHQLEVLVATTQGLEANIERFGNDELDQCHRPLVFAPL
eukprot:TRINITY_DN48692_c0_g1_i1.p1 TRINITY_DN48692_c0_g1~~TRINITY_DN48692_c0_g1_i1.p1  ORF type:complete len:187 (-),score=32.48 TRINITY_DN48692_c0_g1_i1:46-606(-)